MYRINKYLELGANRLYHRPLRPNTNLQFLEPNEESINMFQVLSNEGKLLTNDVIPPKDVCLKMLQSMLTLRVMDSILYDAQRQGRISFYMTSTGEEAAQVGSAQALSLNDHIFGQYREAGVLMHRGFSLDEFMNQCFGNVDDPGKGRQMPVHYGSRRLNYYTISSPLGTQLPQATGLAYALELGRPAPKTKIVMCYFGEGAASEGDFHGALNMAAVFQSPVVFFCRNNGYAISTPLQEQYRGDGIVSRAPGYGMPGIRVDGNDVFAVLKATEMARERCLSRSEPVLLEAITYRIGHHSTSDDWTAYRDKQFLINKGWWTAAEDKEFCEEIRRKVIHSLSEAEMKPKPPVKEMFTDVYEEMPLMLQEQWEDLQRLMQTYPSQFPLGKYLGGNGK